LKKKPNVIIGISSINMFFILKNTKMVEIPIIIGFMLQDQLLINLKFIIMAN